jgi:hypothetical protein
VKSKRGFGANEKNKQVRLRRNFDCFLSILSWAYSMYVRDEVTTKRIKRTSEMTGLFFEYILGCRMLIRLNKIWKYGYIID